MQTHYVYRPNISMKNNTSQRVDLQRMKKTLFFFLIFCCLALSIVLTVYPTNETHAASDRIDYKVVYVEQGDTLWSIAETYVPAKMDIRTYIHMIRTVNRLGSGTILEGQAITLP
jgi:hypothetical protein